MDVTDAPKVHSVIGVDPGPSTGIAFLDYVEGKLAGAMHIQIDGKSAVACLEAILYRYYNNPEAIELRLAQVEAFVTGQSAGTKGEDAEVTRQLAFNIAERLQMWGYSVQLRKKADVSSWGSDKRLKAAGVLRPPENRHANDASRHALFCAVHDAHKPDPLR
jgi:hypothetical protein